MARASKKKSTPPAAEPEEPAGSWRDALFRPIVLFWMAMICFAPLGYMTLRKMQSRMINSPQFQVDETSIVWKNLPETLPEGWADRTAANLLGDKKLSVADPKLTQEIGEKLAALPWVKSVKKVSVVYPHQVHIDVEVRQPVAMIQIKTGYYPVDEDGILLPPSDFSQNDVQKFPVVLNPESLPQGPAGIFWGDPAIKGAAKLAQILGKKLPGSEQPTAWKEFRLKSITLYRPQSSTSPNGDVNYALIAEGGTQFLWGLGPGYEHPKEPSADNKLKRLAHFVKDFGSPSGYPQPLEVDLRGWQEITYQPISREKEKRLSGGKEPY